MDSKSEHLIATNGARVEIGTISHEGREFSATGSVVDHENGIVVGYVGKLIGGRQHSLNTWDGKAIGVIWSVSTWKKRFGGLSDQMYAYRAVVEGRNYHGRGQGTGMIVRLYKSKK